MSEKKQLNDEQLEKVSGGMYKSVDSINWIFTLNAKVQVKPVDSDIYVDAVVTRKGYYKNTIYYNDYYYVDCQKNSSVSDWYLGSCFAGNTVKAASRDNGYVRDSICVVEG